MFIDSIHWIDEENYEAEVTVSDGCSSVVCFSHPFDKRVNERLTESIHCLCVENVVISSEKDSYAKKYDDTYRYKICGKLVEKKNRIVLIGNIKLCLDDAHIPGDIPENSFIEFTVMRLTVL